MIKNVEHESILRHQIKVFKTRLATNVIAMQRWQVQKKFLHLQRNLWCAALITINIHLMNNICSGKPERFRLAVAQHQHNQKRNYINVKGLHKLASPGFFIL